MIAKIIRSSALSLATLPLTAAAELPTLTVKVTGAEPATGTVEISLFNKPESFLKETYEQKPCSPGEEGTCVVTFSALPEGDYAVVVVHDANDNSKLDNGFLGFGAESYAYSNGATNPLFGRASFDDAKFTLTVSAEIDISLD